MVNQNPLKEIIDNDLCTGCGICADFEKSPYTIDLDKFGKLKARFSEGESVLNKQESKNILDCCPFSNTSKNEDEISESIFKNIPNKKEFVGKYISFYAGHVNEGEYRMKGSSGGLGTWILKELLEKNIVDKIIHVKSTDNDLLFEYTISSSFDELKTGAKSKYYPITLFGVLQYIRENDSRFAVVGIPCFLKALRLYSEKNELIKQRVILTLGLVCGHLKSQKFGEMLAWQVGVKKGDIKTIDFREKNLNKSADSYNFSATNREGRKYQKNMKELFGWNWGANFFKYKACDYCDDTYAEVADVMIGDAWISPYTQESLGNNILITRNIIVESIVKDGIKNGKVKLDKISYEKIIESQKSGINHKNQGLAYRLYYTKENISKRVKPSKKGVSLFYKSIFRLRVNLRDYSHIFYNIGEKYNSFFLFKFLISPILFFYYSLYAFIFFRNRFNLILNKVLGK